MAVQPGDAPRIAQEWLRRMKDSADKYRRAVDAVTTSPMELAAAQESYWAARVAEAARQNRFSSALRRVSLAQWKAAARTVGADRIAALPDMKAQKVQAFWQRFLPHLLAVQQRVRAMPRNTYEQRRSRMLAMVDGLHEFRTQQAGGQIPLMAPVGQ